MILGTLTSISAQIGAHPKILDALKYLQDLDASKIEDGRYQIRDDDLVAIFQSYPTKALADEVEVEGHRKYVDIYLMLSGSERLGWVSTHSLPDDFDYDEQNDVWTRMVPKEKLTLVSLSKGDVAILFPTDAHASQISVETPTDARKVVMKVAF